MASVVLATAGYDHTIRFWEATSGICYRTITHNETQVNRLEITYDKSLLAAAGNPQIRIFDVATSNPQPIITYTGHTSNVTSIGFQRERDRLQILLLACGSKWMFSGSEDGTIRLWDLRAPGCQREYDAKHPVNTVVLHANQGEVISGDSKGCIKVWNLATNGCTCELVPEVDTAVRSLSIAADATLLCAANDKGICYVWRVKTHAPPGQQFDPLYRLRAHEGYILKCLISPDVRQLATAAADKTVKLWSLDNFQLERTLSGHQRWVWDCVFSVDAAYLVTASSDCTARLWDLSTGDAIRMYTGHHKACVCCALNDSAIEGRDEV